MCRDMIHEHRGCMSMECLNSSLLHPSVSGFPIKACVGCALHPGHSFYLAFNPGGVSFVAYAART